MPIIDVVMPAFNEAKSIALVLNDMPREFVRHIVVCDNNSTDETAAVARAQGATVVFQPLRGYGNACLKALEWIHQQKVLPDIVVFLDSDYSDHPEEMFKIVNPLIINEFDLVIGSRALGNRERGAMQPQQIFGNWLATTLIRWFYGYHFTDLGPFFDPVEQFFVVCHHDLLFYYVLSRNGLQIYEFLMRIPTDCDKLGKK